jgi:hypothetical protein
MESFKAICAFERRRKFVIEKVLNELQVSLAGCIVEPQTSLFMMAKVPSRDKHIREWQE